MFCIFYISGILQVPPEPLEGTVTTRPAWAEGSGSEARIPLAAPEFGGWIPEGFHLSEDLPGLLLLLDLGLHLPSTPQSCFYCLDLHLLNEWPLGPG